MEVNGQHHAPAALQPSKSPRIHRIGGWMGPRSCLDGPQSTSGRVTEAKHPLDLLEFEPRNRICSLVHFFKN